jgi:hypothetical protein
MRASRLAFGQSFRATAREKQKTTAFVRGKPCVADLCSWLDFEYLGIFLKKKKTTAFVMENLASKIHLHCLSLGLLALFQLPGGKNKRQLHL